MESKPKKARLVVFSLALLAGSLLISAPAQSSPADQDCELGYGMCIYECATLAGYPIDQCQPGCSFGYDLCRLGLLD